jgi:hypothetical protein
MRWYRAFFAGVTVAWLAAAGPYRSDRRTNGNSGAAPRAGADRRSSRSRERQLSG